MKAVLQRVKSASVTVDGQLISEIGKGVLVLAGVARDDTVKDVESLASKVLKMKLWDDEHGGRWKHSVLDVKGEVLCVSQFTLLATTKKGNKPDFHKSMGGDAAKELYGKFFTKVQELYERDKVKDGVFQAMMDVALVNDGPVSDPPDQDQREEAPPSPYVVPPLGLVYRCVGEEVTLEIDTNPPKTDLPGGPGFFAENKAMNIDELIGKLSKLNKEFVYPEELLE